MKRLLITLALCLGALDPGRAELSASQRQGLQVALAEFHQHPPVHWAFRETSVDRATDKPLPAGIFVRLEFKLQQTNCRKEDWKKPECKIKPNGRKRTCLACIKLGSEDRVLGRLVHCPIQTQAPQEPEGHREAQCSRVERAGEDPHGYYFPGQFAFFKALPPD
ncbi:retinoic acid receptor responder protein 2 isoform X2 [Loxodonta africana]|uniref:Retinoic acid receptor responder protein 2 n=2 Tax=Loxodonta africana TaxID=9785 RepID=G3U6I4_LOXAF